MLEDLQQVLTSYPTSSTPTLIKAKHRDVQKVLQPYI
jgi:hypothetical protein